MRSPCSLALAAVCGLALTLSCADPRGRFHAFEDRRAALDDASDGANGEGGAGSGMGGAAGADGCAPPAPGVVKGNAVLALETAAKPGTAILFFGELATPELDGKTAVKFTYRALDAMDRRTEVGETLVVGPFALAEDGHFDAPTPESTLPGSADPILPGVEITSQLTLHGTICGVSEFYCGSVTGTVTYPSMGPTTGHFGITLLRDIDALPARPRYGCDDDAFAPALE